MSLLEKLDFNWESRFIAIKIYNLTERINQEGALAPRHPHQLAFLRDVT